MKLVVQRVTSAKVEVNNNIVGKIGKGYLVLLGIKKTDTKKEADYMINKLMKLRVFEDEENKMNLSIQDIDGEILLIPQFTLYGDVTHNNRPSFSNAMKPTDAQKLFEYCCNECEKKVHTQKGEFGAFMDVNLVNNGPVTIIIEKEYNS